MAKKILICDDDPGILDLMEIILEETGHKIISEQNSLKVSTLIEKEIPDLVILDLWMPLVSGDQLLEKIRKNPHTRAIPVIVMSASRDGEQIAKKAGASAYIPKPFDINDLMSMIEQELN
ncbi:response regulator [Pedobacter agri]|uniref:response regulator n=1 Tax=Pedobacter agri TaxID=454586 RepID=UPI00292E3290|nr:response regulator [Pedobacter agri]